MILRNETHNGVDIHEHAETGCVRCRVWLNHGGLADGGLYNATHHGVAVVRHAAEGCARCRAELGQQ
jgi:hypothetical protein